MALIGTFVAQKGMQVVDTFMMGWLSPAEGANESAHITLTIRIYNLFILKLVTLKYTLAKVKHR
jgi:Na+-driven multidrug efflux pump